MVNDDILVRARPWTLLCGVCDVGLPMRCTCPAGDPRHIISALVHEVQDLRAQLAQKEERRP